MNFKDWVANQVLAQKIQVDNPPATVELPGSRWYPTIHSVKSPRHVEKKFLDMVVQQMLANNPNAMRAAIADLQYRTLYRLICEACEDLKIRENGGNNRGALVGMIQAVKGAFVPKGDGQAWCLSMQQIMLGILERLLGIVSRIPCTESCANQRAYAIEKCPDLITHPKNSGMSDWWIYRYLTGERKGLGHIVAFITWITEMKLAVAFEGNAEKGLVDGRMSRDGGGFYRSEREPSPAGIELAMVLKLYSDAEIRNELIKRKAMQ